jgi:HSP20 family molecular chaperone IbpA
MADTMTNRGEYRVVDREFQNIRELLELLMSEMSTGDKKLRSGPPLAWAPPTDVYETETELVVTMDIAGIDERQISVVADGIMITIRGVRQEVSPRCKKHFHKMEIEVGPFQRQIHMPVACDLETLSTTYARGLLEIRVKKDSGNREKRSIDVE